MNSFHRLIHVCQELEISPAINPEVNALSPFYLQILLVPFGE